MNNEKPRIAFLFATERSGTHMFRSMIEKTGSVSAPAELANVSADAEKPSPISFFTFRANAVGLNPAYRYPTAAVNTSILDEYFNFVGLQFSRSAVVLCDIKYSHMHNFNHGWRDCFTAPDLIVYAKSRNIPIVHLIRKRIYETALSEIYAGLTGVWRANSTAEIVTKRITIDTGVLAEKAERLRPQNCRRTVHTVSDVLNAG